MRNGPFLTTFAAGLVLLGACGTSDNSIRVIQDTRGPLANKTGGVATKQAVAPPAGPPPHHATSHTLAKAYLAGGCFWGVEHYLEALPGVLSVESGYMGGHVDRPTYRQVIGKKTGHLETVRVSYDPAVVSYEAVTKLFFEIHDPTQRDGQGPDLGAQYLSAVFYSTPAEKKTVDGLIARLTARGLRVATSVRQAQGRFWPAEEYHQNYYARTGKKPYCHVRVKRFGD